MKERRMSPKEFKLKVELTEDQRSARLSFDDNAPSEFTILVSTTEMDDLIRTLGQVRAAMLEPVGGFPVNETRNIDAIDPQWAIRSDSGEKIPVLWIRHPGFGWQTYGFPRHEARNIAKWIIRTPPIKTAAEKAASLHPSSSAIQSDNFLVTTEGLGFYYYGKGEAFIGVHPFEQLEGDSDRAAGIVAAAILEKRLEQAIISTMKHCDKKMQNDQFEGKGPLSTFSSKIALSYMLGLISKDAHAEFININKIRNDFAHDLSLDTFDVASIQDRCKNLKIIDRHVGPVPSLHDILDNFDEVRAEPYLGFPDFQEKLADPRFRYVMTAQLFSSMLGVGADNPKRTLPLI
jgi:DNA-binding MltR family transcriptional regulator